MTTVFCLVAGCTLEGHVPATVDTVLGDPEDDNDEDAPGARFNECTDTIHDDGEDEDDD